MTSVVAATKALEELDVVGCELASEPLSISAEAGESPSLRLC